MIKQLQLSADKGQLVEIYPDVEDVEKFAVAKVLLVSDDFTILANISPVGQYDGFSLIRTDYIYRLNINTRYIENIEKLYKAKKQSHMKLDIEVGDFIVGFLKLAKKHNFIVGVELFEDAVVHGFVKSIEDGIVLISSLNDNGEPDGESFFNIEDITRISCDDEEANCLKILNADITK